MAGFTEVNPLGVCDGRIARTSIVPLHHNEEVHSPRLRDMLVLTQKPQTLVVPLLRRKLLRPERRRVVE